MTILIYIQAKYGQPMVVRNLKGNILFAILKENVLRSYRFTTTKLTILKTMHTYVVFC